MTPEQFQTFLEANRMDTAEAIRVTVNGKIDKMTNRLNDHIEEETERNKRIDEMYEWWNGLMTTASWSNTILKYLLGIAVSIATIIVAYFKIKGK